MLVPVALYPVRYHISLQTMGLVPARPLLPSWRSFLPLSPWSPIRLPTLPSGLSLATLADIARAAATSPLVIVGITFILEDWTRAVIDEAFETTIIRPSNPDLACPDDGWERHTAGVPKSTSIIRNAINNVLTKFGWAEPLEPRWGPEQLVESHVRPGSVEVNGHRVTNINRLDISVVHSGVQPVSGQNDVSGEHLPNNPSHPPPSSTATENGSIPLTSQDDITSTSSSSNVASAYPVGRVSRAYHRVTPLSTEPSRLLGSICARQLTDWVMLPLNIYTCRLIASHYFAGRRGQCPNSYLFYTVRNPLAELHDLDFRSVVSLLSRVGLCAAIKGAIDLGIWGCQWLVVTYIGKRYFGWGTL